MKIVDLRVTVVGTPWRELVFLELTTDDGLTGVAKCGWSTRPRRSSPASASWRRAT